MRVIYCSYSGRFIRKFKAIRTKTFNKIQRFVTSNEINSLFLQPELNENY